MKTISIALFLISGFVPVTFLVPERMNLIAYAFICISVLIFGTTIDHALQNMRGTTEPRSPEAPPLHVPFRQPVFDTIDQNAKSQIQIYRQPREIGNLLAKDLSIPDIYTPSSLMDWMSSAKARSSIPKSKR